MKALVGTIFTLLDLVSCSLFFTLAMPHQTASDVWLLWGSVPTENTRSHVDHSVVQKHFLVGGIWIYRSGQLIWAKFSGLLVPRSELVIVASGGFTCNSLFWVAPFFQGRNTEGGRGAFSKEHDRIRCGNFQGVICCPCHFLTTIVVVIIIIIITIIRWTKMHCMPRDHNAAKETQCLLSWPNCGLAWSR